MSIFIIAELGNRWTLAVPDTLYELENIRNAHKRLDNYLSFIIGGSTNENATLSMTNIYLTTLVCGK